MFNRDEPDHEKELRVIVKANDKGSPSLEGTCAFVVNVRDVNDNPPMFDKSVSWSLLKIVDDSSDAHEVN